MRERGFLKNAIVCHCLALIRMLLIALIIILKAILCDNYLH
jgi:hypothetical protein